MPCGYELRPGEKVYLEFKPRELCPTNGFYIIRVMERFEVCDNEGRLVRDLLKSNVAMGS